ncbi:MAG: phosphonate C-P lyase system protein PhnG [Chloroflexota bacterium]
MAEWTRSDALSILTRATPDVTKDLADLAIPHLGDIQVLKNRTGLVMLPYTDSAEGTAFHLGEVLVAEAHISSSDGVEGYGMIIGRDTVLAMAIAVLDACIASNIIMDKITNFLEQESERLKKEDTDLLKQVQATRVEMETF